jgi:hypothetical protein
VALPRGEGLSRKNCKAALAKHLEKAVDVRGVAASLTEYLSDDDNRLLLQRQTCADPKAGGDLNRRVRFGSFETSLIVAPANQNWLA